MTHCRRVAILFLQASSILPFLCLRNEVESSPAIPICALSPLFILLSAACLSVIHNKDLLATIHLLVAMVKRFQPELNLPANVKVEVVVVEVSSTIICTPACQSKHTCDSVKSIPVRLRLQISGSGIRSHTETEVLTDDG